MMMDQTKIFRTVAGHAPIRMVEEAIAEHYPEQEIVPVHRASGRKPLQLSLCCLQRKDWIFSGHRSHAHYLAKGGDLKP